MSAISACYGLRCGKASVCHPSQPMTSSSKPVRAPPSTADDIIKQARRYKSKRELTRAIRLVAKTDLALRSNPPSKRMVLEKLILDLTAEPKPEPEWMQEELPV